MIIPLLQSSFSNCPRHSAFKKRPSQGSIKTQIFSLSSQKRWRLGGGRWNEKKWEWEWERMRPLCDVCESAAATLFCAADEAALCRSCDEKVHMCNKLASRHVRVGLADPSAVPRCDICENSPAFFYCEVDGSSLCLQCDMIVHVGGKRTHGRYLLFRQRVEFPGDKPGRLEELGIQPLDQNEARRSQNQPPNSKARENLQNHTVSPVAMLDNNIDGSCKMENKLIDLNSRPQRLHGQTSTNQEQGVDVLSGTNNESASVVPVGSFKR